MPVSETADTGSGRRDLLLYVIILSLSFLGLLILYPASSVVAERELGDAAYFVKRQALWFVLGISILIILAALPLSVLQRIAFPGMIAVIVLLGLVYVPGIGKSVSSASKESFHRWMAIGPVQFQPSEFAKPAVLLYLARLFSRQDLRDEEGQFVLLRLLMPMGIVGIAVLAIMLEPQFGTTVCFLAVIAFLIYIAGFPPVRLILFVLSSFPLVALLVYLAPYRWSRYRVWLDPYKYRFEGGYQLVTSYRAFREGGLWGRDLAHGFAHRYLTYGHTDFILALFGEDYGLFGIVFLMGLYIALAWRGFMVVARIREPFAFMLGSGVLIMLLFQVIMNMAVVVGLVPTTGVSLPFVSYGGSSLISSLIMGGLLLNVSRYARFADTDE